MTLISSKDNKLSFGIELEVIICHKQWVADPPNTATLVSPEEEALMPEPMEAPWDAYITEWIEEKLEKVILTVPGAKFQRSSSRGTELMQAPGPELHPDIYMTPTTAWAAHQDVSVTDDRVHEPKGQKASSIELVSAAMWDCPAAHRHVQDIVVALSTLLRWRVNIRTGFHVHVGAGAREQIDPETGELDWKSDKFGFEAFQRAGALIWAADRFLHCAHPPERQINTYAQPVSTTSQLANGQEFLRVLEDENTPVDANAEYGRDRRKEFKLSTRFPDPTLPPRPPTVPMPPPSTVLRHALHGRSESSSTMFPAMRPARVPAAAWDRIRPYVYNIRVRREPEDLAKIQKADMTVEKGIAYILCATTRHRVAKLLSYEKDYYNRLNYNFTHYDTENAWKGYNTVEFREATGTFDPTTIAAWSSVCLAIFRFCTTADDASYWTVVWNLIDAHNAALAGEPHHYDMISLMIDCGAFGEASFFEKSLRKLGDKHWFTSVQNNQKITPNASLDNSPEARQEPGFFESDWPVTKQAGGTAEVVTPTPAPSRRVSLVPKPPTHAAHATGWRPPFAMAETVPTSPEIVNRFPDYATVVVSPDTKELMGRWDNSSSTHINVPPRPVKGSRSSAEHDDLMAKWNKTVQRIVDDYHDMHNRLGAKADQFDANWRDLGLGDRR
ncbi:Putative protein of unknown function [Podospora comata]|uniref:Amidoligase enzyme n=1 Tax=Podospora comata TaxID=48703 RepID=A0ABY6RVU7_PODCO|nr:Putative protein of unknown function [Podospora comata]